MATYVWVRDRRSSRLADGLVGVPAVMSAPAGGFRFPGAGAASIALRADDAVVPWGRAETYAGREAAGDTERDLEEKPGGPSVDRGGPHSPWLLADGPIPADWAEYISMHGIPAQKWDTAADDGKLWAYAWVVPVFHLETLGVWQSTRLPGSSARAETAMEGMTRLASPLGTGLPAKAERMAIRAVYAVGLDIATVLIGMVDGVMRVLSMWPGLPATQETGLLFSQALDEFDRAWSMERGRREPAALGADPEFVVRGQDGRVVPGDRFVGKRGEVGCDAVALSGGRLIYPLLELRPEPSSDPLRVVANIRRCMLLAVERIGDDRLEWLGGGMPSRGLPLGGHVHFGGMWLTARFLRVLDLYVAVPLLLIEDERSPQRRPRFGALGDFRRQPHGFEYRTLASWLASPRAAKAVFALSRLLSDRYWELGTERLTERSWQEAFYRADKVALRPLCLNGWERLRRLPDYERYAEWIEPLRDMVAEGRTWDDQRDFRRAWRIPPFHMV